MFWLVVGCVDGFGADTLIKGIYSTREEAIKHCKFYPSLDYGPSDKIVQVNYGELDIDYDMLDDVNERPSKKKNRKRG